jgi:hypothetical protein
MALTEITPTHQISVELVSLSTRPSAIAIITDMLKRRSADNITILRCIVQVAIPHKRPRAYHSCLSLQVQAMHQRGIPIKAACHTYARRMTSRTIMLASSPNVCVANKSCCTGSRRTRSIFFGTTMGIPQQSGLQNPELNVR